MFTPSGQPVTTAADSPASSGSSPSPSRSPGLISRLSKAAISQARAGSSASPLTARRKKNCRFLARELENVIRVMERQLARTEMAKQCCEGVLAEVRRAEASAKKQLSNNSDDAHGRRVGGHSWLAPVFKMLRAMRDESEKGAIELEGQLEIVTNHFSLIQASIDELKTHWEPRAEILGALDKNTMMEGAPALDDDEAHASILRAGREEDSARTACQIAFKITEKNKSTLGRRRSEMFLAMKHARQSKVSSNYYAKRGTFGTTGKRDTDPSTRKMPLSPDMPRI